ncbi:hypothetical protein Enr8_03870 [Blastopirellula retiformator]|uniref:Uncharacterized protein n=1 Tax=Blastopirellula retiformator TaxID=2527970 RepID=A0A5C5VL01_9BACT|nr:hypothetical protein Enr8_03870 [Blastopirellula retiformator]
MPPIARPCQVCGGRAYGRFCSYACYRVAELDLATQPNVMVELHAPSGLLTEASEGACSLANETSAVAQRKCVACGGSGRNSKGGPCFPCSRPRTTAGGFSLATEPCVVAESSAPSMGGAADAWPDFSEPGHVLIELPPSDSRPKDANSSATATRDVASSRRDQRTLF